MEDVIFPFNDQPALQVQCDSVCQLLYEDVLKVVNQDATTLLGDQGTLLVHQVKNLKETYEVTWFARYGCAVLVHDIDVVTKSIKVIGLDNWKTSVHSSILKGREATAEVDLTARPAILTVGSIPYDAVPKVIQKAQELLSRTEGKSSQSKNHKTPTFLYARLVDALRELEIPCIAELAVAQGCYQGGTADVGLHTACLRRNTSFPLVASVYSAVFMFDGDQENDGFYKSVCLYFLHHLRNIVSELKIYDPRKIDRCVIIIREIRRFLFHVKDKRFHNAIIEQVRHHHKAFASMKPLEDESTIMLPSVVSIPEECEKIAPDSFPCSPNLAEDGTLNLAHAREEAKKNLPWSDLMIYNPASATVQDAWVALGRINRLFWCYAEDLAKPEKLHSVEALRTLMHHHTHAIGKVHAASQLCVHVMKVELMSWQMLVAWIAYCWAHRIAVEKWPLFREYSAALNPKDVWHLVLQDAGAIDAVGHVRKYLEKHRDKHRFPFREHADTMALALAVGRESERLQKMFDAEQSAAEKKISDRYETIQQKITKLKVLDSRLLEAKRKLLVAEDETRRSRDRDYEWDLFRNKRYLPAYRACQSRENAARGVVNTLKSQIAQEELPPQDLFLPLPRNRDKALQWLFFLYIPAEFKDALSLAHLAQTKLWRNVPSPSTRPQQDLLCWFSSYNSVHVAPLPIPELIIGSTTQRKSSPLATGLTVRHYSRETGVFFPDSYPVSSFWRHIDPFSTSYDAEDTARLFTESLPPSGRSMQDFVTLLPSPSPSRGNWGIATQNNKPDWLLTKEEYHVFASVRAFPNLQLRQLLVALNDKLLPFADNNVHVLVQQLIYQIGDDEWKTDSTTFDAHIRITDQLNEKADQLKESPNNTGSLLLFGLMSSFFGQFGLDLQCSRKYTRISRTLADRIGEEVRDAEKVACDIYWKQAKLYGCALLSTCAGDCSDATLLLMVELVVLFKNKSLFATEVSDSHEFAMPIQCIMAKRIPEILRVLASNLDHLTKCLGYVVEAVPPGLNWTKTSYCPAAASTACFEAHADRLYSVNVLNGTVLVDGVPPGFLPSSIVKDPLYTRTFGSRNFECVVLGVSHFRTARLVDGRFIYEFKQRNGQLYIFERDQVGVSQPCSNERLLLLPRSTLKLSVLLSEPYSHWYSTKLQAILVRDPFYKHRSICYTMTKEATFRVPLEDRSLPVSEIFDKLERYERLVLSPPRALKILTRIEYSRYILFWVNNDMSKIRCELPRVGLEFSQSPERVDSLNFSGFFLHKNQRLDDTLRGVTSYLILVDERGNQKVLFPDGKVGSNGDVILLDQWDLQSQCHIYDVHRRFRHLVATDDLGRLQLACVYAATSSLLVEQGLKKTGTMIATDLVRHCWTNEVMPDCARDKLLEVSKLSNLSCTLRLMCCWVWTSSNRLSFLKEDAVARSRCEPRLERDSLAVREYEVDEYFPRLSPEEELYLLGTRQKRIDSREVFCSPTSERQAFVESTEASICKTCVTTASNQRDRSIRPFPLDLPNDARGLEREIHEDLKSSWGAFCSLQKHDAQFDGQTLKSFDKDIKQRRTEVEHAVLQKLNENDSAQYIAAQLSGAIHPASTLDLLRLAQDESVFQEINPFLSADSHMSLRIQIVEWMQLCVLEDKVRRILWSTSSREVLEEAKTIRAWDPWRHVHWLVFEVERELQIRPYQYSVVKQLLDYPKSMIQLNMGLGKTSVLVPMLILDLTKSQKDVVRINMLASIINVVKESYRMTLTASVQNIKVLTLPFQRNFPLEDIHAKVISETLLRCKDGKSFLLVTPQHRNSLLLKQYDPDMPSVVGLGKESFVDIIDESDAILHQSFQLVYAVGNQEPLPDGKTRWTMFGYFLQIFAESKDTVIAKARMDRDAVHCEPCVPGAFPRLRLLRNFEEHQEVVSKALCKELIADPPHEFLWMKRISNKRRVGLLVKIMSDSQVTAREIIQSDSMLREHESDILAARGCIAYGLLFHCLKARHRVDYGIDCSRKKMAVPFSASDTPKERADFSHPDVPIIYTCLSYMHDGLTLAQLKEALMSLGTLGPSAQQSIYSSWIDSIRNGPTTADDIAKFDSFLKVDTENSTQLSLIHRTLRFCMKLICFWMDRCVFSNETYVFPQRRVTSAWNLVDRDKDNAIGFSGTTDNAPLMPSFVKQRKQEVLELQATNGEMVDRILQCTRDTLLLQDDEGNLWKNILRRCHQNGLSALIDVGGLMAGVLNKDAAVFMADCISSDQFSEKFRGIVYYDTVSKNWNVYELKSKLHRPLQVSSLHESECFAYYDESRCRGSDLKLMNTACALVTLEPGLTKDRFLQGCARLRKLRPGGQSIVLAGTAESLQHSSTAKDVLELTLRNTARAIRKGLVELFERGMDYFSFPDAQDIDVSLKYLYSDPIRTYSSIVAFFDAEMEQEVSLSDQQNTLIQYCKEVSDGTSVEKCPLAEECEREVEHEEEREEEEELACENPKPYSECDWNFEQTFSSGNVKGTTILKVKDVIRQVVHPPVGNIITWSDNLECTTNWLNTIVGMLPSGRSYLRPVNAFLYFSDGRIVLISDYEANKLLPYWWEVSKSRMIDLLPSASWWKAPSDRKVTLCNLSLAVSKIWLGQDKVHLPLDVRTSAKLFRGYVSFDDGEKQVLERMFVQTQNVRDSILELLQLRHRLQFLDHSDLDKFSVLAKAN